MKPFYEYLPGEFLKLPVPPLADACVPTICGGGGERILNRKKVYELLEEQIREAERFFRNYTQQEIDEYNEWLEYLYHPQSHPDHSLMVGRQRFFAALPDRYEESLTSRDIHEFPPPRRSLMTGAHERQAKIAARDGGWGCHYCGHKLITPDEKNAIGYYRTLREYFTSKGFNVLAPEPPPPEGRQCHMGHKFPRSKGGRLRFDNLVLACYVCNIQKGARYTYEQFLNMKQQEKRQEVLL